MLVNVAAYMLLHSILCGLSMFITHTLGYRCYIASFELSSACFAKGLMLLQVGHLSACLLSGSGVMHSEAEQTPDKVQAQSLQSGCVVPCWL